MVIVGDDLFAASFFENTPEMQKFNAVGPSQAALVPTKNNMFKKSLKV
jgi:hypothetical protein